MDRDPKTENEGRSRSRDPQLLLHRSGDARVHRGRESAVTAALETRGRAVRGDADGEQKPGHSAQQSGNPRTDWRKAPSPRSRGSPCGRTQTQAQAIYQPLDMVARSPEQDTNCPTVSSGSAVRSLDFILGRVRVTTVDLHFSNTTLTSWKKTEARRPYKSYCADK